MSLYDASGEELERELHEVLGQSYRLLEEVGDEHAKRLVLAVERLRLERDGGRFHPMPGDNWTADSYEAVFEVEPRMVAEFVDEVMSRIWDKLEIVLRRHGREDVFGVRAEPTVPELPEAGPNWREQARRAAAIVLPSNQARQERTDPGYPTSDGLTFSSRAEVLVYELLVKVQKDCPRHNTLAIMPLPGAKLRDAGVRTPDFVVIGNGRAVVVEVDGPHHYAKTRVADDQDRDRHWDRCGISTLRISVQHVDEPSALEELLREELLRRLWRTR